MRFLFLGFLFCVFALAKSQANSELLIIQANDMASLFKSGDYKGYIKYVHSSIISGTGGTAKMIELLYKQNAQFKSRGVTVSSIIFFALAGLPPKPPMRGVITSNLSAVVGVPLFFTSDFPPGRQCVVVITSIFCTLTKLKIGCFPIK